MTFRRMTATLLAVVIPGLPVAQADDDTERSMLVLDASGSMWGRLGERTKIEVAREAVDTMLVDWPEDHALGLVAYGHRRKGDCNDIELLLSPEPGNGEALRRQVDALTPTGMTPISAAVHMAAETLRFTERKATVILVSDGEETCKADPCALGTELARLGIDFTAHVVGFDLPDGPAREQLQCLARETGGRYLEARDAAELGRALGDVSEAVAESAPEPKTPIVDDGLDDTQWYMPCVDLYESDYAGIDLAPGDNARTCQALCAADERCNAYTYTRPGWQAEYGKCWLKTGSPWQRNCDECTSGAKRGVQVFIDEAFVDPSGRSECAVPPAR